MRGGFFRRSRENKGKTNMKQLKFMLAAATAIGLATAAQAVLTTNTSGFVSQNFLDIGETPVPVTGVDGLKVFSYAGDPSDNANDSQIVKSGKTVESGTDYALSVSTSTNPVLCAVKSTDFSAYKLETSKSLYIDTKVQFTVTPWDVDVEATDSDKLMIYLKETATVTTTGEGDEAVTTTTYATNLMVKAAKYTGANAQRPATFEEVDVVARGVSVKPGAWYRLVVTSTIHDKKFVVFKIQMATEAEEDELVTLGPDSILLNTDSYAFPSLVGIYDAEKNRYADSIQYIGFAGEGMVDDIVVAEVCDQATTVDFTLILGDNVTAVEWTINGEEKTTAKSEKPSETVSFDDNITIEVSVDSVTYEPGYVGAKSFEDYAYNKAESGSITILATQFGTVKNGENGATFVEPNDDVLNKVTDGVFKPVGESATVTELEDISKAITWASSKAGKNLDGAISYINTLKTDLNSVTTNNVAEAAYLFNCPPTEDAVKQAAEKFVFEVFTPGTVPTADDFAEKGYNGEVVIEGATTLRDETADNKPDWEENKQNAKFYRALLKK